MCRLHEWKKKVGVCPYNERIHSTIHRKGKLVNKEQRTLI